MMTLEEAIRHYEESEKMNKELAEICVYPTSKNHNLENAEKCRQIIEWLRELQERRKQPEIIKCKDCKHKGTKNCVANAWTTIFGVTVKDDFYCGLAERRTDGRT